MVWCGFGSGARRWPGVIGKEQRRDRGEGVTYGEETKERRSQGEAGLQRWAELNKR